MNVLLELRPAFEGHSGIPQEARLLFSGLAALPEVQVEGLLQSGNLCIARGLSVSEDGQREVMSADEMHERLSRVVVSLHQHRPMGRLQRRVHRLAYLADVGRWAWNVVRQRPLDLSAFEPAGYEDWIWRTLFDKTLPPEDRVVVVSKRHRLLRTPWSAAHGVGVVLSRCGLEVAYPPIQAAGVDLVIAETPFPGRFVPPTQLLVRYHDAIPVLLPHTIKNMALHRDSHHFALRRNARDGAWFACVSESTRRDLLSIVPGVESRAFTVPNMVSHHYAPETRSSALVPEIVRVRKNRMTPFSGGAQALGCGPNGADPYLLMVATIEPRKNHATLIEAWHRLRQRGHRNLNLILVGSIGWSTAAMEAAFEPWLERGGLHLLHRVPADELSLLYRHATATVCPSVSEGFDFPGVEAMRCGGVVVASDIPVHRDVFMDGCEYFETYSEEALARVVELLIAPTGYARRESLRQRGIAISDQYTPTRVLPMWQELLERIRRTPAQSLPRR